MKQTVERVLIPCVHFSDGFEEVHVVFSLEEKRQLAGSLEREIVMVARRDDSFGTLWQLVLSDYCSVVMLGFCLSRGIMCRFRFGIFSLRVLF